MSSCACDCGSMRRVAPAAPVSPLQIVPADDIVAGWDAAVRVAVGTALFTLPDVSGNGFNLDQAVALNQATVVVGGGPNGNDSVLFDGVNDFVFNAALDLPAPGVTPTTYWTVLRQKTWTLGDTLWVGGISGGGRLSVVQDGVAPALVQFGDATANFMTGLIVNVYQVLDSLFGDSAGDYLASGGIVSTGANAGPGNPAPGFTLGANAALTTFANIELCEFWIFRVALTAQQRSALRSYATAKYGPIP